MADFVAVLKKTIEALGETTPAMRAKVYGKARATVDAKLAAISPPPPPSVAARQKQTLEDAIEKIEAEYATRGSASQASDPLAELEDVFAALKAKPNAASSKPAAPTPSYEDKAPAPPAPDTSARETETLRAASPTSEESEARDEELDEPVADPGAADGRYAEPDAGGVFEQPPARRRNYAGLIVALVALIVLGGGGYAVWLNKDDFSKMLAIGDADQVANTEPAKPAPKAETAEPKPDKPGAAGSNAEPNKFTQRLNADGTETDEGAANSEPGIGEGTSLATATRPSRMAAADTPPSTDAATGEAEGSESVAPATEPGAAADASNATAQEAASAGPAAAEPGPQIAVGQKAIYYEERTSSAQGSADKGSVVWSLVQESPGADLPPEPAIRGEATIPGKDLQLRMTIKRNADKSLPASHIIELIFLTPDNFAGGGIDNILRFAMKGTEEAAGSPLIGIPAKIADGFFLVALNDSKAEVEANMTLLRRQDWIDVPVIYKSGRRALITMEKGIPGQKVFDEAMKAWQAASAG